MNSYKTSRRAIVNLVTNGIATDITHYTAEKMNALVKEEEYLFEFYYSMGKYGCNAAAFQGNKTGNLYVVTKRTAALFYAL